MPIGIDPTVDFACHVLLGSPQHPRITLHFLNAVLRGEPWIADVRILNPIVGKDFDELPKYPLPDDNGVITDPIEQWMFFFRRARLLTADELLRRLPDPAFVEAVGVLEMIAPRDPEERRLYEARLKMQRDEHARMEYAVEQGEARGLEKGLATGREEGRRAGRIQLLQQLLNLPESSVEDLRGCSAAELAALEQDLQRQLRSRG